MKKCVQKCNLLLILVVFQWLIYIGTIVINYFLSSLAVVDFLCTISIGDFCMSY